MAEEKIKKLRVCKSCGKEFEEFPLWVETIAFAKLANIDRYSFCSICLIRNKPDGNI